MVLGSWASGSLRVRALVTREPRVRVLTYHRFGSDREDPFCVHPAAFDTQMRFLAERRLAISLGQLQRFVGGREELPDGACLVTIDDGLMSTFTEALPVLAHHGVPAVTFICAGLVGADARYPEPYMGRTELRALLASGSFHIGSHAFVHRSLRTLSRVEALEEARSSKARLEDHFGVPVTSFAYPFGTFSDFDAITDRAVAEAGYEIAFNSMHGAIRRGADPISLPRIKVEGGEPLWLFRLLCRGAMDPWRAIDRTLYPLQRDRIEHHGPESARSHA
jgi:peptidoglycan/xylan/chitin deacetylase (PgdA/CDA1 family)